MRDHVFDRLGDLGMAREFGAVGAHPVFERGDPDDAPFLAFGHPYLARKANDLALDLDSASMRLTASNAIAPQKQLLASSRQPQPLRYQFAG